MVNRDIELLLMNEVKEILKNDVMLVLFSDLDNNIKLLPKRIICRLNSVILAERHNKGAIIKEKKEYLQVTKNENNLSLTFVNCPEDARKVYNKFLSLKGQSWYQTINGVKFVMSEVGQLTDVTEFTAGGTINRLVLDVTLNTLEEVKTEIELVKVVNFKTIFLKGVQNDN